MVLPIKKQWYDMILSGEKKEEYRDIKPYYIARFRNLIASQGLRTIGAGVEIEFRNGYSKSSPSFVAKCSVRRGTGNPEWGAEPGREYFILEIKEILS